MLGRDDECAAAAAKFKGNAADITAKKTAERRLGIRADLLVHAPIGIWNQTFLLDTTVSSIHVKANFEKNACFKSIGDKEVDRHQEGVADKAESANNVLYSPYAHVESGFKDDEKVETMKHIVPFALDSRGCIGMDAFDFIRKVYGKQVPGGPNQGMEV